LFQKPERFVGVTQNRIDTTLAPPLQIERNQTLGQLRRVAFIQEEVIVVELNRIDVIFALQVRQHSGCARRVFCTLPSLINGHDTAECATKRTTDTRLVNDSAATQESG
jgi:hypothetical protein